MSGFKILIITFWLTNVLVANKFILFIMVESRYEHSTNR